MRKLLSVTDKILIIAAIILQIAVVAYAIPRNSSMKMTMRMSMKGASSVSASALLLETGDYLLLETGDKLLLE